MAKKEHPATENPLANMGLDDFVRGITSSESGQPEKESKPK